MFGGKTVVGLDIGSDKVKAVQLRKKGNTLELERFGIADIYPDGMGLGYQGDVRELKIQAARRVLEESGCSAKHCVLSVSGESIIVRYIQLPQMPEAELRNALRYEAEEYIPYRIDEVNLDFVVLGPSAQEGKVDVLLVCAKKDLIADHVGVARALGRTPVVIDVDSFAFMNYFEELYRPTTEQCVCLLNIGAEHSNINIYVGGTSRFSRDVAIAGNAITQAIAQKAGVPLAKADELKKTIGAPAAEKEDTAEEESSLITNIRGTVARMTGAEGGDVGPDAVIKATRNVLTNLITELRRSIQFFENQSGGRTVQRLYLGGGSSKLPNLSSFLQTEMELETELIDPLQRMAVGSAVNQTVLQSAKEHIGVAVGLALRKAG